MRQQTLTPVYVSSDETVSELNRINLGNGTFNEAWLQEIVQKHPGVLPISDIEPGFGKLIPIAIEVPVSQGYIDNLFLTAAGDIAFAELKLWKNPQARREVVAQCLDYIAGIASCTYSEFEAACLEGQQSSANCSNLYDFVKNHPDALSESEFIDAVSFNLSRGRILAIAAGDGIRRESETLSNLLQDNASSQFTFALVELAVYENRGEYLIVPSTLARTTMIARQIFIGTEERAKIAQKKLVDDSASGSISATQFFDAMEARRPGLAAQIQQFLERLEVLDVEPVFMASMNLKRERPSGSNPYNLGYITKAGRFFTTPAGFVGEFRDIAIEYHAAVASIIGGQVKVEAKNIGQTYATTNGKSSPCIEDILPELEDQLFLAMKQYLKKALEIDES